MKIMYNISSNIKWIMLSACFMCHTSFAGVSIDVTRVVFEAADNRVGKSVGITSSSESDPAYLVKAMVTKDPEGIHTQSAFLASPSLFRLEPGGTSQVRIIKKTEGLAIDRESLFYLRFVAMPSGGEKDDQSDKAVGGVLQIATGQVVKLFYRPNNLPITQKQAMSILEFHSTSRGLMLYNPTPYYISLQRISIEGVELKIKIGEGSSMVAPYSNITYPDIALRGRSVTWEAINDFGSVEKFSGAVR